MSYQVLARKWRPKTFAEVVGQQATVTALSNALNADRLHHALLFTGTRGVGKTTIARIFAKALNCETGVSAEPCGHCTICEAIDQGRFVDLIEVDAASRTKVDDTRDLLDNVQYAPTSGRFKVYLIDEVHMLSTHSFNALLKTLEEPPAHVKFLLATTDPQKLPMTILSRCIQFPLRALELEEIDAQLKKILDAEGIAYTAPAVLNLSRAAKGSLRDALSLLDQAIAYSNSNVSETAVNDMLGQVDGQHLMNLFRAIHAQDGDALMAVMSDMIAQAVPLKTALQELISLTHSASVYLQAPKAVGYKGENLEDIAWLSDAFGAEGLQLQYQIALIGKRDFDYAPDARTAFEMTLLRMLGFQPDTASATAASPSGQSATGSVPAPKVAPAAPQSISADRAQGAAKVPESASTAAPTSASTSLHAAEPVADYPQTGQVPAASVAASATTEQVPIQPAEAAQSPVEAEPVELDLSSLVGSPENWHALIQRARLTGMTRQLAMHMVPQSVDDKQISLLIDSQYQKLNNRERCQAIEVALNAISLTPIKLEVGEGSVERTATAANFQVEQAAEEKRALQQSFVDDPQVQALLQQFDGEVDLDSIKRTH